MSEESVQVDEATAGATAQPGESAPAAGEAAPDTEDVLEALRDVVDPELGVNVVDLGLVYGVTLGGDGVATIDMTLTSAACPLTDVSRTRPRPRWRAWSPTSGSTGYGCRRGARTRSPKTAASNSAPSASTSDPYTALAQVQVC